ncbi:unnamed protein product [Schistosoma margrebowiei]|uniref:Uncharacterized protein n=1 Tax=Schistosoma margrebowiei TaxID=48269 RepID=A0A183MUA7_9TREM|nr:unnamed protein product [Schistosoma margrebowiei]
MPLDIACNRNPSHDGIVLPAFFRHCIDYIEQYGLSSEGIYRVRIHFLFNIYLHSEIVILPSNTMVRSSVGRVSSPS